jgi:hypothetical protein
MSVQLSLTIDDLDVYARHDSCVAVVSVHEQHVVRLAHALADKHPGIIFLWGRPSGKGMYLICAVRPDRHQIPEKVKERLAFAGDSMAKTLADKQPVKKNFFRDLFRKRLAPGWQFTQIQ